MCGNNLFPIVHDFYPQPVFVLTMLGEDGRENLKWRARTGLAMAKAVGSDLGTTIGLSWRDSDKYHSRVHRCDERIRRRVLHTRHRMWPCRAVRDVTLNTWMTATTRPRRPLWRTLISANLVWRIWPYSVCSTDFYGGSDIAMWTHGIGPSRKGEPQDRRHPRNRWEWISGLQ